MAPGPFVPAETDWYVLVSGAYPWGSISFYPAKRGGLVYTFPHQSYNAPGRDDVPWRTGSLCLDTPARSLGRRGYTIESYEAELRLPWHFGRALAWLEDASRGGLVKPGEPFELPQYPADPNSPLSLAFSESPESFATWRETAEEFGTADFYVLRRELDVQVVKAFKTLGGKPLLMPAWGSAVTQGAGGLSHGFWFRLRATPVLDPWQGPATWGELRAACRRQGIDIDERLRAAVESVKGKDGIGQVALFGFPIPATVGGAPERMHWLALNLPKLAGGDTQVRGFRKGKEWSWQHNRERLLRDGAPVRWLESENWYPDQLQTRGRLAEEVTSKKILSLGAGALGSPVAELLVRAGAHDMLIVDDDRLEAGNPTRHTLGLDDLNKYKAAAVAKRLNQISPFAHVEAINSPFPPSAPGAAARMNECEIVVDCTGSDEVLYELSSFGWKESRLFFSASLSLGARRVFCFSARGDRFPHDAFRRMIDPWLRKDLEEHARRELPREGIGCWHPVFPARADDVWLMASAAVKHLERVVMSPPAAPQLVVFEQVLDEDGVFSGVRRILSEVS